MIALATLQRILRKGPHVIAFRATQQAKLHLFELARQWDRLDHYIGRFWDARQVARWAAHQQQGAGVIGPAHYQATRTWFNEQPRRAAALKTWADDVATGSIELFDERYHFDWAQMPWDTDWRYGHRWAPAPHQSYSFYQRDKAHPYDVKFPWELSRFPFLFPLAQAALLGEGERFSSLIHQALADWQRANPFANSVNWRAMECSMRGITLALVTQMMGVTAQPAHELLALLLGQLTRQGEFLYHTIEYTDLRGNHYAANLVALLLMGHTLAPTYKPAQRWIDYAAPRLCAEIELQYCADGVNFEKSVGYHRLVTELYLLGLIVMERCGQPVTPAARDRIWRACEYTRSYIRPDGLAPNWGDNDSALVLGFDQRSTRDHRPLLALAACYFRDRSFQAAAGEPSAAIPWLLGAEGVAWWQAAEQDPAIQGYRPLSRYFEAGGMVVSRSAKHYLLADFGEVGMKGRGGHGHNDTFSFELALAGQPLVIDPGCPIYTGDLTIYDRFRATSAHNVLAVDGEEMARLLRTWQIADEARPLEVTFEAGQDKDCIEGVHGGYQRLPDPVTHRRRLEFWKEEGRLRCTDDLHCAGKHTVRRWLHFAAGLDLTLEESILSVALAPDKRAIISWSAGSQAVLERGLTSDHYGHMVEAPVLVLDNSIEGDTTLYLDIRLERSA